MYKMNRYSKRDDREIKRSDLYSNMVRIGSELCDCGMGRESNETGKTKKCEQLTILEMKEPG